VSGKHGIQSLVEEAARRKKRKADWKPHEILFEQQLEVFNDPSRYRLLRCGRRSGKSYTWGVALIDAAMKFPKSTPLYCCMSRQDARDILWPVLDELNDRYNLQMDFNRSTGDVTLLNGSRIILRGAGTMREINKLRGRKYPAAVVDEAQAFGMDLAYLLDEVIEPATADYHGWIGVSGTPSVAPVGVFYEMDQGAASEAWSHHSWTFFENPTMPNPQEFIKNVMRRRGWDDEHPGYRREYLGQWVRDDAARAFKFRQGVSLIANFPEDAVDDWQYTLGVDVGFVDPFSWVVIASSQTLGQAFVLDSYEEAGLTTMEALTRTERFCSKYEIHEIAIDTGGAGKLVAEDWKKMTNLPIKGAEKTHKGSQVATINGDFAAGKLQIVRDNNEKMIADLMVLEWDADKRQQGKFVYKKGFADHSADAFQYAYHLARHHYFDLQRIDDTKYGTREWYAKKEDAMEQYHVDHAADSGDALGQIWDDIALF